MKARPSVILPAEMADMLLVTLHRHHTALVKIKDLVDHDLCPETSEALDAFRAFKADGDLRAGLQAAIALAKPAP